jgi:hypothetical protein
VSIVFKYLSPLILCLFAFYIIPWTIYKVVNIERHERKSEKEESFMTKNTLMMTLNCLIIPLIMCAILSSLYPKVSLEVKIPPIPKQPRNVLNVTDADRSDNYTNYFPLPPFQPINKTTNQTTTITNQTMTTNTTTL